MKTKDKCPICGKELNSVIESHIIPALYSDPIWKRNFESTFAIPSNPNEDVNVYFGRKEKKYNTEDNLFHYTSDDKDMHPHKLAEKELLCATCEKAFNEKIETKVTDKKEDQCEAILQSLRKEKINQEHITLEGKKANSFYALFFSMIYRISISRKSGLAYFSFVSDKEQDIIKGFIIDLFEDKSLNLEKHNISLSMYKYNEIIDVSESDNEEDEKKKFGGGCIALPIQNSYVFILFDFIFELSFNSKTKLQNNNFSLLKIKLLNPEKWNLMVKVFQDMVVEERHKALESLILEKSKGNPNIVDAIKNHIVDQYISLRSLDYISSEIDKFLGKN